MSRCTVEDHRALSMLPEEEFRRVARNLKLWPAELTEELGYRLLHGDCPNYPSSLSCKIELAKEGAQHMNKSALRISRYRQALTDLRELQEGVRALDREIEETVAEHRRERPLTREEKSRIRDAVLGGRLLCCDAGRGNLRELLDDPIWIDTLHEWAYERTGCSGEWERHPELVVYKFWREFDGGPKSHIVDGTVYGSPGRWAIRCPCTWVTFGEKSEGVEIAFVRHVVEAHEGTIPASGS